VVSRCGRRTAFTRTSGSVGAFFRSGGFSASAAVRSGDWPCARPSPDACPQAKRKAPAARLQAPGRIRIRLAWSLEPRAWSLFLRMANVVIAYSFTVSFEGTAAHGMAFVLGILFGSFANVCIARIPAGMSIVRPPSHCFACKTPVRWFDNLPIVSWLVLRGRCRACGARFSARYLLVEVATGLLSVALWQYCLVVYLPEDDPPHRLARYGVYLLFVLVLEIIAFIDLDTKLIPDKISYPAIPTFFLFGLALRDLVWWDRAIGVAVGYGIVRLISDGYYWMTKREGMGYGDGKLLALIGGLLGWHAVVFSLFGGAVLGSVIGITAIALARRKKAVGPDEPALRHVELPFGPFLVAAALMYLFLQDTIALTLRGVV
jgi:leader peptidase (prepilin peptidase) / N-methyltransferase